MPESMGILHPGTSFGVFWSTNVARNWYRNEKYPLIPEKPGIRRGIPREGDILDKERKKEGKKERKETESAPVSRWFVLM
jgi:hypothetical protein